MMVNPTKRQMELYEMFMKEIAPFWIIYDEKHFQKLRDDAPEDIKKKYEMFKNSKIEISFGEAVHIKKSSR